MTKDIELIKGDLKVEIVSIGEGLSGDYDPDDPDDVELLRFYCSQRTKDGFEDFDDASYCTRVPASTDTVLVERMAEVIMRELERAVDGGGSPKKPMEQMSWITVEELKSAK